MTIRQLKKSLRDFEKNPYIGPHTEILLYASTPQGTKLVNLYTIRIVDCVRVEPAQDFGDGQKRNDYIEYATGPHAETVLVLEP